ncbi:MAG: hypothetical protein IKH06_01305 [Clostridiales bacterium]|nr:hypothetical protein [Clostridiales bacterium]
MKKLIASVLCLTIAMSLAACSKKAPEATSSGINVTMVQTTATAPSAEPSATETTVYNPASEFVKERTERFFFKGEVDEDGEKEDDEEIVLHIPELLIKSSYADSINKEINASVERYKKMTKGEYCDDQFCADAYIAYLTKEGILSLVVISYEEYEQNEFKVYNIDTKTGEKVDNARIAQIAGVSNIRKAAMDALQAFYNKKEWYEIKNYKVVKEKGEKKDSEDKEVEKRFSEKHLNDKMKIGLTSEGKLFFVSNIYNGGGAAEFDFVYDADGNDLDGEDNKYWVGERYPDEEDDEDEEDLEDEDDDFIPEDDDDEDED